MTEPLTLTEAKAHLRIVDGADDTELTAAIIAARQTVEQYLNATIVNRFRTMRLDTFPTWDIALPEGPVISVTNVTYVDPEGVTQTLAANTYLLTSQNLEDWLSPAYGTAWPSTRDQRNAVVITYVAGMFAGSPLTFSFEDIKSAIKLTLGDLWENREGAIVGVAHTVNPTVERLLHYYRRGLGI